MNAASTFRQGLNAGLRSARSRRGARDVGVAK
jgi:hypothetical protein